MNSEQPTDNPVTPAQSSGAEVNAWALLRQTRESRGVHLVALASTLKVPTKYLEALEAGDIAALPDPVFARALAASVCRHMGVDPETVLRHWPRVDNPTLKHAQSFNSITPTSFDPYRRGYSWWTRGALAVLVLAIAAGLVWLSRSQLPPVVSESSSGASPDTAVTSGEQSALATEPASGSASDTESSESQVTTQLVPLAVNSEAVSAAPSPIAQPVAEPVTSTAVNQVEAATEAAGEGLRLTASRRTWVEVRNQSGVALISRILAVGETFEASEGAPWSVILGNAQGVVLTRSGQAVDLSAQTRGNVARLQVE